MPALYSTSWLFNNNKLTHFSVLWSAEVNVITTCIKTKDQILKFSFQYLALKSVAIIRQGVKKPAQHIIRLYRVCVISGYFILRLSLKQWAPSADELTEVVPNDYYSHKYIPKLYRVCFSDYKQLFYTESEIITMIIL